MLPDHFLGTKCGNSVVRMLLLSPELLDPNGMCLMPQEYMSCLVDDQSSSQVLRVSLATGYFVCRTLFGCIL